MILASLLALVLALSAEASSTGHRCNHVLKESFNPPTEWVKHITAPNQHPLELRINLAQHQFDTLESHLYAVSDPDSPRYGQHLSKAEVKQLTAPHPEALAAVNDWLASHGFDVGSLVRSSSKDWVKVKTSVEKAEQMLDTKYHVWENTVTGESIVRTTRWSVPEHLKDYIDLVHPTTMFGSGMKAQGMPVSYIQELTEESLRALTVPSASSGVNPSCDHTITPACLQAMYNTTGYTVQSAAVNQLAISSFLEQFANKADFRMFLDRFVPDADTDHYDFKVVLINGGQNNQSNGTAGVEANLDIQYVAGIAYPTKLIDYSTGGRAPFKKDKLTPTDTNEPYMKWLDYVLEQDDLPQTFSFSYGDVEQTVPLSYAKHVCRGFAALGVRGSSVLFASGDFGVGDGDSNPATTKCQTNDGRNKTEFLPAFPASCPYVTTVGGTENIEERAVTAFGSGGGFSNYFSRPRYQEEAVEKFLESLGSTHEGLYNPSGRAYPDVAAQGMNYTIAVNGKFALVGGTSASTPTFSSVVSLLNDARIAEGLSPLGFLNPLMYRYPRAFHDITVGNNPGCGTLGFNCTTGWDPVTGLGTPKFDVLKDIVLDGY